MQILGIILTNVNLITNKLITFANKVRGGYVLSNVCMFDF